MPGTPGAASRTFVIRSVVRSISTNSNDAKLREPCPMLGTVTAAVAAKKRDQTLDGTNSRSMLTRM